MRSKGFHLTICSSGKCATDFVQSGFFCLSTLLSTREEFCWEASLLKRLKRAGFSQKWEFLWAFDALWQPFGGWSSFAPCHWNLSVWDKMLRASRYFIFSHRGVTRAAWSLSLDKGQDFSVYQIDFVTLNIRKVVRHLIFCLWFLVLGKRCSNHGSPVDSLSKMLWRVSFSQSSIFTYNLLRVVERRFETIMNSYNIYNNLWSISRIR